MLNKRKITWIVIISLILLLFPFDAVSAAPNIIYESSARQNITAGVTLENITRFTVDGWFNINVLRVDLSNPYVKVDSISDKESIQKLVTTKNLAISRNAVAAINASFFNPTGGGKGYPDGPIVESGKIISAYSEYNRYGDVMASFSINKLNQVLYDYWKTDITLVTPKGKSIAVTQYNKPSRQEYKDFTIIDSRWNRLSIGKTEAWPDIVEMVVVDGKVAEIRQGQPAVAIPESGYVVVTRQAGGKILMDNFKEEDPVEINITTNPDWNSLKMSVTGASILVKDGKIPEKFSFDLPYISQKNPRTAVGSSKDGKQLILVTVDGRQNSSIGMTQREIALLMQQLGAYNALNLDGGGSTTMVARTPGTNNIEVVNSPSDGGLRGISTALGVFSVAPPAPLAGLIIEADDTNVFVNTSRAFKVAGYDKYYNPVQIKPEEVKWSVSGIQGSFKGNVFYPKSVGEGKIIAQVGDVSGHINISSLSSPVKLELNHKSLKMSVNQSRSFTVTGVNKNGYSAKINPEDINWKVYGNIGRFEKNVFTATAKGTGYIDAYMGDTHAYCGISVATDTSMIKDGFETLNGSFLSYPQGVEGSYEISTEQKHSGNSSGKLCYSFTDTEETQAAYMVFPGKGISIEGASKIGVWVYNTHANSNWLRAEVQDSTGNKHLVGLTKSMDWTGWRYVEASPDGIKSPATLTRLYIAKVHPIADSGSIYFDDLTVTYTGLPPAEAGKIPQDTVPVDEANRAVAYQPGANSFRFAVLGQSREYKNPLEKLLLMKFSEKTNKYLDAAALVGSSVEKTAGWIKKPVVATRTGYNSIDIKNSRFIQLDISGQGLRKTNSAQWHWFLQQLDSFKGDNIFISLADSPESFSDPLEADLFQETLTKYRQRTNKNVWVFYKGNKNESYMKRGIKYITSAGIDVGNLMPENADMAKYILVTVQGNSVTFEFKPII
jgi:exopolysaccharide biosynthesis protein